MDDVNFEMLYREHRNSVYRYARILTGSPDAGEDITQECFLALARGNFEPGRGEARAYLFGAARRLACRRFRKLEREVELEEMTVSPVHSDLPRAVGEAVAALPPMQREAVLLFTWEGFTLEEIAGMTGVDTGTIKSRLARGRETLRRTLAAYRSYVGGLNGTVA
ncbi:MAG: RNA polymerase sigma factor [Bryobacterales bacterium]|nr:RNA polymerase sigma factor [Bryobacterales bacterium]